jgi:hypothetical protein
MILPVHVGLGVPVAALSRPLAAVMRAECLWAVGRPWRRHGSKSPICCLRDPGKPVRHMVIMGDPRPGRGVALG